MVSDLLKNHKSHILCVIKHEKNKYYFNDYFSSHQYSLLINFILQMLMNVPLVGHHIKMWFYYIKYNIEFYWKNINSGIIILRIIFFFSSLFIKILNKWSWKFNLFRPQRCLRFLFFFIEKDLSFYLLRVECFGWGLNLWIIMLFYESLGRTDTNKSNLSKGDIDF